MSKTLRVSVVLLGVIFLTGSALVVQGQQSSSAGAPSQSSASASLTEAEALFQAQKWTEAARAFAAVTKAEPSNGRAWLRLGSSLHSLGQYEQAAQALERAVAILRGPIAMYNLACAYARLGQKEKAFEWLTRALNAGFAQINLLQTDDDLASLRTDARFKEVLSLAERQTKPCLHTAEHRQFDFWIGEWDVQVSGQPAGTNSIQRLLNGCVLLENWSGAGGGTGKSFNFYNAATRKWHQTWVDGTGNVLEFAGEYKDGKLLFLGETVGADGTKTLQRLTFFNLSPERLRQFWEQSTDGGKTWTVAFDGTYIRKQATPQQ